MPKMPSKEKVVSFLKKMAVPIVIGIGLVGLYLVASQEPDPSKLTSENEPDPPVNDDDAKYETWSFLLKDNQTEQIRQIMGNKDDCEAVLSTVDSTRFTPQADPWLL